MSPETSSTLNAAFGAVVACFSAYIAFRMRQLEKNTNSIKDALVIKTEKEALTRGEAIGHAAGVKQEQNKQEQNKPLNEP